ncbi:MAG: transcriptional repressor [Chloroflexi bacterium]|jgi:Fe2+ or Zn2+ uptake regulation protein|nr:transcriptional repressor [Chloroflexota bacterium]
MTKPLAEHLGEPEIVGEALRQEGKRMTPQRALLLQIIAEAEEHLDAEEIHRRARAQGARLSLSTVYRTLSVLSEMNLLRELHLGEEHHHYERTTDDHYHLYCLECGEIREYWPPDGGKHLRQIAQECGFELVSARVEMRGFCEQCQAKLQRESGQQQE